MWEQLSGLVRDAAWLEAYGAAVMLLVKETMQAAVLVMGPTKQPVPGYLHARDKGVAYGEVAGNLDLVRQMGPVSEGEGGGEGRGKVGGRERGEGRGEGGGRGDEKWGRRWRR